MWVGTVALVLGAAVLPGLGSTASEHLGASVSPAARQQQVADKIDVNSASVEKLQEVPGIGPATAERIVAWRQEHGPFQRLDELLNVRGIGLKSLEKLRPYLRVVPRSGGAEL